MNRERIMMRAVADALKERLPAPGRVKFPTTTEVSIPLPEVKVDAPDMTPIADAFARLPAAFGEIKPPQVNVAPADFSPFTDAMERQTYALKEIARPHKTDVHAPVTVDMQPVADAIDRQTEALTKLLGGFLKEWLDFQKREIEVVKDRDGKLKGLKRK